MSAAHMPGIGLAQVDRLDQIVVGLIETVSRETTALQHGEVVDLSDFNTRKSHGLLELSRALRARGAQALSADNRTKLQELREQLNLNAKLLKVHLEAVQEIADLMTAAINESQSDGTYSATGQAAVNYCV